MYLKIYTHFNYSVEQIYTQCQIISTQLKKQNFACATLDPHYPDF